MYDIYLDGEYVTRTPENTFGYVFTRGIYWITDKNGNRIFAIMGDPALELRKVEDE